MRLHVGVLGAEKLLGAIAGQSFHHIDIFAAAVVAPAGVAFGIFIGEHAADGLLDGGADVVFAGDQFQAILLATGFVVDGGPNVGIVQFDKILHGENLNGLMQGGGTTIVRRRGLFVNRPIIAL